MYLSGELDHCRFTRICGLQTPFYLYLLSRCVHKGMELQTLVMSSNGGGGHSNISVVMIFSVIKVNINIYRCIGHR